jgi:hypothetical protein
MARYNEILVGRINRGLQKYFGIKGDAPVPQLAGDVSVNHQLFSGAENRYHEGWGLFGSFFNTGAGAGTTSGFRLRNPTGSNVIAVVTKLLIFEVSGTETFNLNLGGQNADYTTPGGGGRFDRRGIQASTCIPSTTNAGAGAGSGTVIGLFGLLINQSIEIIQWDGQEIPLAPGDVLEVRAITANQSFQGTIFWRERFLEESERA